MTASATPENCTTLTDATPGNGRYSPRWARPIVHQVRPHVSGSASGLSDATLDWAVRRTVTYFTRQAYGLGLPARVG
jgi:hypothetical protein